VPEVNDMADEYRERKDNNDNNEMGNADPKHDVIVRLKRIEGQVKGIQKMVEEDKNCIDILTQVAAVRAAINRVGAIILEHHSKTCIEDAIMKNDKEQGLKELIDTVQKFLNFVD